MSFSFSRRFKNLTSINNKFNRNKLGQTVSAAVIVGIIALVLVIYVILVPSARDSLGPSPVGNTGSTGTSSNDKSIIDEFSFPGPGYVQGSSGGREITLPSLYLKTSVNSEVIASDNAFYVTNSFFGKEKRKSLSFSVDDANQVDNVKISFLVKKQMGFLKVTLNGIQIYEDEILTTNINPIQVSSALLQRNNVLEFSVDGPGVMFWNTHEYLIDDFKMFADVTAKSKQSSLVTFDLKSTEYDYLNKLKLKYYPSCEQNSVDKLYISVNGREVYAQVPDCKVLNIYQVPFANLKEGINSVEFATKTDSYLVDQIAVETSTDENRDLIYFFDLNKNMFNIPVDSKSVCGEIDGRCPSSCSADQDQDCCEVEYTESYWCDAPTMNENNRCVGRVDQYVIGQCTSGYEDEGGNVPDGFEGICGDDNDGVCPVGCSKLFDKDCCYDNNGYWCDDITNIGLQGVCADVVNQDSCSFCPTGYQSENRTTPKCSGYDSKNPDSSEVELLSKYTAEIEMKFVDDAERKKGKISVNGNYVTFSTIDDVYTKDISLLVIDGNNYVQVIPDASFNLVNVKVKIKQN